MTYWDTTYQQSQLPVPANEAIRAADEQRCICIIQDLTSDSNKKHTHTLPISYTTDQLFEIVAKKLKYVKSTFSMTFSKSSFVANESVTTLLEPSTTQTLGQCGFANENQKTYIQVGMKDEKKPTPSQEAAITEDSGDDATTSATGWSYSNDWFNKVTPFNKDTLPKAPPIPPKIGQAGQRRNAVSHNKTTKSTSFAESISEAAAKIKGEEFKGVEERGSNRLIGLVNQAMTCYLNSLIQTLYMTPEFRNALYEWEYKGNEEEVYIIPFQLQRLFLALQTSDKHSVETTDLTLSFGWDSSEAWQQHDIQELCRVMFDALEQKFKESAEVDETEENSIGNSDITKGKEANDKKSPEPEIIKLYEGTMKDYVQCEECKNETSRNDTYLDIPITIRPFGSTVTYKSVMEGLKAFVEPEILNETNQYFCEKCNKKCDAKKGLKFTSFPYLLTFQLKRFDFDYATMHRVKLNDRMYFPEELDLNSFIEDEDEKEEEDSTKESLSDDTSDCAAEDQAEIELQIVEEEARSEGSSRDSGNDDDRPSHVGNRRVANVSDDISEEGSSVDEGIDIESQSGFNGTSGNNGTEDGLGSGGSTPGAMGGVPKSEVWSELHGTTKPKGKYIYELFSIMIHSGSAVGGHYYAYIKSFDDGLWYSFNDQIVSPISQGDIDKSYGGSGARSTYSSSFSSSTNAYMLMYRLIDPVKNKGFITAEQLPDHIKKLADDEEEREKLTKERKEKEKNMCNIKVFCRDPALLKKFDLSIAEVSYDFHNTTTLENATTEIYELLKLNDAGIERENCRIVKYDNYHQSLEKSLDDVEENLHKPLARLLGESMMSSYLFELLMETKQTQHHFQIYKPGGITVKVFPADYSAGCFLDHVIVRLMPEDSVYHLKQMLAKVLRYPQQRIRMAYERYASDVQLLTSVTQTLKAIGFSRTMKIYVDLMDEEEYNESLKSVETETDDDNTVSSKEILKGTRLWELVDRAANLINVELVLPEDTPVYQLPLSRPISPPSLESPASETDSIPPLISMSPAAELKICPEAPPVSARTTPSSDEGLGSYDESSAPKTAEGSPKERAQPVECQGGLAASPSSRIQTDHSGAPGFAHQLSEDRIPMTNPSAIERMFRDSGQHLRRNSEEDEGRSSASEENIVLSEGILAVLREKLQAASYDRASPTSSLKCEDGSMSESGSQTSGEFELHDQAIQQGDGAADSAGSCSTIDSTGTLCNPSTDTSWFKTEDETLPVYSYSQNEEDCSYPPSLPTATKMSALPGVIDTGDMTSGVGHHGNDTRNLTYGSEDRYGDRIKTVDVNLAADKKAFSSFCDCAIDMSADLPSTSSKNSGTKDLGPGYLCSNCGKMKQWCISSTENSKFCPSSDYTTQDPESGEGSDDITPLFCEIGAGDSMPDVKPKFLEMTCMNNPDLAAETNRQRTESTSSVLSDLGWGDQSTPQQQYSYFKIYSVSTNEQKCQVLKAKLDKRTTVGGLKRKVHPIVQIPTRDFSIFRVFQSGQENELNCLNDTFILVPDEAKLKIKHQRALRKDECRCKVFHLCLTEDNHIKPLVDWVMKKGMSVKEAKDIISQQLGKERGMNVKPEHVRLRKKCWHNPGKIYLNDDIFGNEILVSVSVNSDIFLEILQQPEQKTSHSQLSVFCRRWNPSSLTVGPFQEVILDEDRTNYHSVDELKLKISKLADIEVADIEWAKLRGLFPCHTSVLEIHDGLDWDPAYATNLHSSPASINEDGAVVLYRDKNELLKELSDSEKSELTKKEETRLAAAKSSTNTGSRNLSSAIRPYSRKEKALKIYTGASRKKKDTTAL